MNYKIEIPNLKLDFTLPPSKSVVHRNLIVQFLRAIKTSGGHGLSAVPEALEGPQPNDNDDICATRACLKALYEGSQND